MSETFIGKFLRNNFYFQRALKRIPLEDIGNGYKYLVKKKQELDMARFIQPTINKDNLNILDGLIQTAIVSANVATIILEPSILGRIHEVVYITASHNDVAARNCLITLIPLPASAIKPSFQLAGSPGHDLEVNTETLVFPFFHDKAGAAAHDHPLSNEPVSIQKDKMRIQISITGVGNGKILTVKHLFRRIL